MRFISEPICTKFQHTGNSYEANYIGSKQLLHNWIWENTPKHINSVFDAFSGSSSLSYMYKTKGLRVIANDRLRFCYHISKAIIENSKIRLSNDEINHLLSPNLYAETFIHETFNGLYFGNGVHTLIDQFRANCNSLNGYKKDLALFALGKTCINMTCGFGNFTSTSFKNTTPCTPKEFKEKYRFYLHLANSLVFDNGHQNIALNEDVNEIIQHVHADLIYFDPPYATEFSVTNYEKAYHFVEGLMTYWKGLTIRTDTKSKSYDISHTTLTKDNMNSFLLNLLIKANRFPYWIISYRDHAFPTKNEIQHMVESLKRSCKTVSTEYQYTIAGKKTAASKSKEFLFICKSMLYHEMKSLIQSRMSLSVLKQ